MVLLTAPRVSHGTYNLGIYNCQHFRTKKNPMATVAAGEGFPVAILNRNEPIFYCVPAKVYEALIDKLEDAELNALANARL